MPIPAESPPAARRSAPAPPRAIAPADEVAAGVPLALGPAPPRPAPPRDAWLRLALFATLLGAVLTIVYAWILARQNGVAAMDAAGLASYYRVLVPLLAITAVAGVLVLERAAVLGMCLLLLGSGFALAGGGVWLAPGTVFGCIWAARYHRTARTTLGFLLLVPGIAAGYYGLIGVLSFASQIPARGLPPGLSDPLTLRQALAPLELLPVALLGAWLLVGAAIPKHTSGARR